MDRAGAKSLLWNFLSAMAVVAIGAAIITVVRADPPRTADEFANVVFLGVLWFVVFAVVLYTHLKS